MAAIASAFDPLTGRASIELGPDPTPVDVAREPVSACFRIEPDGRLRLLTREPAGPLQPAPLPN